MKLKSVFVAVAALLLVGLAGESDARRVGGGRSVGSSKPSASAQTKKSEEKPAESASTNVIRPRVGLSPASPARPPAVPAAALGTAAGAAAGAAAGSAAASADAEANKRQQEAARKRQQELAALQQRFEEETKQRKLEEERRKAEAAAKAAEAARKKREQEEAKRFAALENERKARREIAERAARCRIKPVMSDEEIARCR